MFNYSDGQFDHKQYGHIYHQSWLPKDDIKAVVLLAHGMSEHSGRYTILVEQLIALNYAVYSWDHPGHGRSGGHRKYIDQFRDFTDIMAQYFEQVKAQHPTLPIYLIGHSMGGLISVNYLLDHQADFDGVILSAPAIKHSKKLNPITEMAGKILSKILPKFEFESVNSNYVCRDPKIREEFRLDPLSTSGYTSIRLLAELLTGMERVQSEAHLLTLPILILQGTDDRIVDPEGASSLKALVTSEDKTLLLYQDFYHELFNDIEKERVLFDVSGWLESRVGRL